MYAITFASSASNELTPLDSLPGDARILGSRPIEIGKPMSPSSNISDSVGTAIFKSMFDTTECNVWVCVRPGRRSFSNKMLLLLLLLFASQIGQQLLVNENEIKSKISMKLMRRSNFGWFSN